MSAQHNTPEWQRARRRALPVIRASLPSPCVDCGGPVEPGQSFDVAHVLAVTYGGTNELSNLGASHRRCNRAAGGRMGARRQVMRAAVKLAEGRRLPKW